MNTPPSPGALDDAYLRLAFSETVSRPELWERRNLQTKALLAHEMLYWAVVEVKDGGLEVLKHMEEQRREIERLQHEVDRLQSLLERSAPRVVG